MPNTRFEKDTTLPPRHLAPLERSELRRERVRVASSFSLPLLAVLLVAGGVACFVFKAPLVYVVPATVVALVAGWYIIYQSSSPRKRRKITELMIGEENRAENEKLVDEMEQLSSEGFDGYAITLGKFLQHKRAIEAVLDQHPDESPQRKQVAELVDSICFGVAEQFDSVASIEKRLAAIDHTRHRDEFDSLTADRRELLSQVIDAYKTLKKTRADLPFILDPGGERSVKKPDVNLQELVDQLRYEEEIASKTRARMRRDNI